MRTSAAEVAGHFRVDPAQVASFNAAADIYPGYPGMVITDDGEARTLQAMTWGFPVRLKTMKPTSKPKPVNNAREDKLATPFWKPSFERRRCLIPASRWAEAVGKPGKMTRTWYSVHGADLFAIGGIWRWTEEWGNAYSMVMVNGCSQMVDVHDRMPVLLRQDQWDVWTRGSPEEAFAACVTCDITLVVDHSTELWSKPGVFLPPADTLI